MSVLLRLLKDAFSARTPGRQQEHNPYSDPLEAVRAKVEEGNITSAIELCAAKLAVEPNNMATRELMLHLRHEVMLGEIRQHFPGSDYLEWLQWLHAVLVPRTYLEIGVATGQSLQFARPPTMAVGVDPALNISHSLQAWTKLFCETSNDFFAHRVIRDVFGEDMVSLAFLDGLHTFDQTLLDLMNVEHHCDERSLVLLHDILPVIPETAERERKTPLWVGDTWKVLVLLTQHRPDLNFFTIPAFPSGLCVITGLNASSPQAGMLRNNFDAVCATAMDMQLADYLPDMNCHQRVVANDPQDVLSRLAPHHPASSPRD